MNLCSISVRSCFFERHPYIPVGSGKGLYRSVAIGGKCASNHKESIEILAASIGKR